MIKFFGYLSVNVLILLLLSNILPAFRVVDTLSAVIFVLVLTLLNWTVVPIIKALALPVSILTFGLINGLISLSVILFTANIIKGISISGDLFTQLFTALIITFGLSVGYSIVNSLVKEN